jgi:hypothetical protein
MKTGSVTSAWCAVAAGSKAITKLAAKKLGNWGLQQEAPDVKENMGRQYT